MENSEKAYQATNKENLESYLEVVSRQKLDYLLLFSEIVEQHLLNENDGTKSEEAILEFGNFTDSIRKIIVHC